MIRTALIGTTLALALGLASAVTASDHLDGDYQLDPKASDDPSLMAQIVDLNAAMVAVMRKMKTRLTIDGDGDQVTVTVKAPMGTSTQTLTADDQPVAFEDHHFGAGTLRTRWEQDGTVLVMESDTTGKDGKPIHNTTRRFLEDPDTLIQQFEVSIDGAEPVVIRRVFRRM